MDRLVLLAIADCAADNGANAYPSMAKLAQKTGLSDRGIQRALARLVALGELVVSRNKGPRGCNRYCVVMATPDRQSPPTDSHPESESGVTGSPPDHASPPTGRRQTPDRQSPGTVHEPSKNDSSSKSRSPRRGTRLPTDFAVTPEMASWALTEATRIRGAAPDPARWDSWLARHTETFCDYWRAKAGAAAVKLDWPATWRNWIRREIDRAAHQPDQPGKELARPTTKPSTTDQRVNQGLALAAKYAEEDQP